jgi:hypothetical protein
VLTLNSLATAAAIASWPCRSPADLELADLELADLEPAVFETPGFSVAGTVFGRAPGAAPVDDATAAPVVPAARAAVTAAAAITLARLRMRILLGFVANAQGIRRDSGGPKKFLIAS